MWGFFFAEFLASWGVSKYCEILPRRLPQHKTHRPRRRRITLATATTSPSPGVGPRAHRTRVHRRVQRRAAGRSKGGNLARRGHRRAVGLAHVLPRVGVVGRLLRLCPPELQPRPLDRQRGGAAIDDEAAGEYSLFPQFLQVVLAVVVVYVPSRHVLHSTDARLSVK